MYCDVLFLHKASAKLQKKSKTPNKNVLFLMFCLNLLVKFACIAYSCYVP